MIKFFNPGAGYLTIKPEIDRAINRVLTNGDLILRKDVEVFEENLAKFVGTNYAIGLNSGTDALYLALKAVGVGPGDKVLVSAHTFVASVQVVVQVGATPVLIDMDGDVQLQEIHEGVKAIILCHIAGEFVTPRMQEVVDLCRSKGIYVIEDACQALGAIQDGRFAGSIGDVGCFSFYPAKILGAYGDAGGLVTNNKDIYTYVMEARNHFKTDYSDWGINSRLDNIQAAVLNVKMKYLGQVLLRRQLIAQMYSAALKGIGLPIHTPGRVWQDYIIQTPRRDELYQYLKDKNIETMKNEYPMPVLKPLKALLFESQTLRLPINENITDQEVSEIIHAINNF